MTHSSQQPTASKLAAFPQWAGRISAGVGVLVLISWGFGWPGFRALHPRLGTMRVYTALSFLLAGAALWLLAGTTAGVTKRRSGIICAGLVILIAILSLIQSFSGWESGLNTLLEVVYLGAAAKGDPMPWASAITFVLLGSSLLLLGLAIGDYRPAQLLALMCFFFPLLAIASFSYAIVSFVGADSHAAMAVHSLFAFVLLSVGVLLARPQTGVMAVITGQSASGLLARRLLPAALLVPVILGWLTIEVLRAGLFVNETGLALFALSNAVLFMVVVWWTISSVHRTELGRQQAERRLQEQLERLNLLDQITRAIGERQDLQSILQVVIRSLEDHLPIDFGCVCLYDAAQESLTVTRVGIKSQPLAEELAMPERACIKIDQNGLSRCVRGQLVHEPDLSQLPFPFPQRLAQGGLGSLVAAPLLVESSVFGVLIAARREVRSFTSGECEFLRQLSEHVALAAHQAQIYSALQQAYDDLRQTQQAVMQQERLRALGQMASGIAHDINNAISPIALYTESLLEQEPNLSPRARDYLQTIARSIDDVAATVTRLREFYREREPQLTLVPVHLSRLMQQVVDLTRARWSDMPQQRGIVIKMLTDLAPDLAAVMGVESEIREALTNLIFNAVDAMPEGGTLTLRTRVAESARPSNEVRIPRHVHMEVTDTGVGMDEDTRRRCLEPFFTTKGERGTGLGLAMVYGVVQRHNADIEIESIAGKGTSVRVVFPVPIAVAAESSRPEKARIIPSCLRILVVDDDPLLLKSLRDTLETEGHRIVTANNGQAGIDTFRAEREGREPFAVVITDLGMPYMDGRRVASAVKESSPSTPVILLTGWGQRMVADADVPPHVNRVLSKPPKLRELREALAEFCQPTRA